jgi:hypothetical protein
MDNLKNKQFASFFKDSRGKIVIWQSPNLLLYGWIVFKVVAMLLNGGQLKTGFEHLSTAILFTWAFFELTKGVNYFRKALGAAVLAITTLGFFR